MNYSYKRFMDIALPIIKHEKYQQMRCLKHHKGTVYAHSMDVAYFAYKIAFKHDLDLESIIRGSLLHYF